MIKILPVMVKIYARLINAGRKTFDDIPTEYVKPVKDYLGIVDPPEEQEPKPENSPTTEPGAESGN